MRSRNRPQPILATEAAVSTTSGCARRRIAAVVIHVRVSSELNEAAFAGFRRVSSATKCNVSLEPGKISVQSPTITAGKTLAIAAEAPWAKPSRLQPAPSNAVLEIDGENVGRKLM